MSQLNGTHEFSELKGYQKLSHISQQSMTDTSHESLEFKHRSTPPLAFAARLSQSMPREPGLLLSSLTNADIALFTTAIAITLFVFMRRRTKHGSTGPEKHIRAKTISDPDPLLEFDLNTAKARNHIYANKTVRYPYYQTMAHQPMHINNWIEIDSDYTWYLEEKARVIKEQGKYHQKSHRKHVLDSLPENDDVCNELLDTLVDWLPKRYPTLFERIEADGILNKVTGEAFVELGEKYGVEALKVVSRLVQDDFLMAKERSDGKVYFVGGLVAFPGFYLLSERINMSLGEVHKPVPYFNEKLLKSVERTLKRFGPEEPFERTSWEIADDRNIFFHNAAKQKNVKLDEDQHPGDLFFRMDHQTFRKLPRSKGIIFGVHPILRRLEDLADSPLVPSLLAHIYKESDRTMMTYKLSSAYQDRLVPYLEELHAEQIRKGIITGDEQVSDFRSLVPTGEYPTKQTSLRFPTASELRINRREAINKDLDPYI